ncbi:hypothetical protein V2A60_004749 [Cordyceps javanica]
MVNVAGRSKGCAICRRRKVKVRRDSPPPLPVRVRGSLRKRSAAHAREHQCDLGFPQCQRCVDSRLACPGPRLGAFFVHARAAPATATAVVAQELVVQRTLVCMPPPPATAALAACRADAFDQLFVSHFIDSFGLPRNVATGPTWLERLPSFLGAGSSSSNSRGDHNSALVTASIRSAAMLSYGTWACDEAIRAGSYHWYARALGQLYHSVGRQSKQRDGTLEMAVCAAVMLIHFETWAGTSRNAWVHHVRGAASLLEAAGPEACRRGFLQSVFSHLRFQAFLVSMQESTVHAFAEPRWLEVPFREQGKTLFDELVDALFAVQRCLFFVQKNVETGEEKSNEPLMDARLLIHAAADQLAVWNGKYMTFLRPASWIGKAHESKLALPENTDAIDSSAAATSLPGLPEAALVSLFHAGRLVVARLASLTAAGVPDTAEEDSKIVLQASSFSRQGDSTPTTKVRPFMMLPGLKITSLWSPLPELRAQAHALLLDEQILSSPMADIALTSEGYFSHVATLFYIHR